MTNYKLSEHFYKSEFEQSATADKKGIDNSLPNKYAKYSKRLATTVLETIREAWHTPIVISSGYRCPTLNKAVGGAANSDHLYGAAADIKTIIGTNKQLWDVIMKLVKEGKINCRQIIWEGGTKECPRWIHISVNSPYNSLKKNEILYIYNP